MLHSHPSRLSARRWPSCQRLRQPPTNHPRPVPALHATPAAIQQHATHYLLQHPELTQRVLGSCEAADWRLTELTEGRINFMFRVDGPTGSACLKCYLPYAKAAGESFRLSLDRMAVEAAAMQQLHSTCPAHVPQVLHHDPAAAMQLLQYLPPPHQKLLSGLVAGQRYPEAASQLGRLLASYLWGTSVYCLPAEQYQAAVQRYANADLREANENVVLRWPFEEHASNRCTPGLEAQVARLRTDPDIQEAVRKLRHTYHTQREALVHNDLHTGNLLVTPPPASSLYLIDWEFATYGPLAFDLGSLVANLLLSAFALPAAGDLKAGNQQLWILQVVEDFWQEFEAASCEHLGATAAQANCAALPRGDDGRGVGAACNSSRGSSSSSTSTSTSGTTSTSANMATPNATAAAAAPGTPASSTNTNTSRQAATVPPTAAHCPPPPPPPPMRTVQQQAAGYAGICMLRLIGGMHHYPAMDSLPAGGGVRARHEAAALQCGLELLLRPEQVLDSGGWAGVATRCMVASGLPVGGEVSR